MVDNYSGLGLTSFLKHKSEIGECFEEWIKTLKAQGFDPRYLRIDPAGENKKYIIPLCHKYNIVVEMTATGTPQLKGKVERRFAALQKRGIASLVEAGLSLSTQRKLFGEAIHYVNQMYNLCFNSKGEPPYTKFHGQKSPLYPHLVHFGRIGYVLDQRPIKGKWKTHTKNCIMVGYAPY